jgi:SAM-dependent methyltransferase
MWDWAVGLDDEAWAAALAGADARAPQMPPAAIQEMFVGSSGVKAFREASLFWARTKSVMKSIDRPMTRDTRVLDVGVGWARLYRWALRDIDLSNLTGVDIDPRAIAMCREAIPDGDFRLVNRGQPYPRGYDLGILYSVFSHLSEAGAHSVLAAAREALVPGGLLALTTLKPAHIDVWHGQRNAPFFSDYLSRAQFDRQRWWERAEAGEYLYVPTGGGDETRPAEAYGEAVVPKGWWEGVEGYRLVTYETADEQPQTYVALQTV